MNLQVRDIFFNELYKFAKRDKNIIFLTGDMGALALEKFKKEMPKQFINMGPAEQNMISVAAGLSLSGKRVFVYGIIPFITTRCLEQIKIDICCMNLPVIIIGIGIDDCYKADGPTHCETNDLKIMSLLPNLEIYTLKSKNVIEIAQKCCETRKPLYIRLGKEIYKS